MSLGLALLLVTVAAAQPYRPIVVSGASMQPTYSDGSVLWTLPSDRPLRKGDVVVAQLPGGPVVKRVAFTAGDQIPQFFIAHQWVDVSGCRVPLRGLKKQDSRYRLFTVPDGHVYLLGDNVSISVDSRTYGPVPVSSVIRRVASPLEPVPYTFTQGLASESGR